jgi:hypothetical protein
VRMDVRRIWLAWRTWLELCIAVTITHHYQSQSLMSQTDPNDKSTLAADQDGSSSGSTPSRPLTRGFWTYYGDGVIEYEYTPTWGNAQRVCGVLGKDKAVSHSQVSHHWTDSRKPIEIVKRGFPNLAWVDADRFDFEIYNHRGLWVRVMEDAWELLNRDPPLVWVIKIKELPEERHERKSICSSLGMKARQHTDPTGIQESHHHNTRVLILVVLIAITALTYFLMRGARVVERVSGK